VRRPRPLELGLFVEAPALAIGFVAWQVIAKGWAGGWGGDFKIFRAAGHALVHGQSPYVEPTVRLLTGDDRFVYPAPFALPFAMFNLFGPTVSTLIYLALSVSAVILAVRLLGVTDWRCYGAALLGAGTYGSFCVGSIGPFLLLAVAAGWRYRDRTSAGIWLALAAAAKLFLWPVLVWLIATRRFRATAAAAATLVSIVGVWAMLDLHGLREYASTLRVLDAVEGWTSYSPGAFAISAGAPTWVAHATAITIAALGVVALVLIRDERKSLEAAVAVSLLATPILWMHYLILLVIPIALARPRLAVMWALPIVLWVTHKPESNGILWRIAFAIVVISITTVAAIRKRHHAERAEQARAGSAIFGSPRA
jgi:alpha-1,2-mannosyltransferase